MKHLINIALFTCLLVVASSHSSSAQSDELQKYEVGAHFTAVAIDGGFDTRTEPGLGGRFTFNLSRKVALEAEGNFFPRETGFGSFRTGGRAIEGLFGVKIGQRYKRFGFFGKARPGFISFSRGLTTVTPSDPFLSPSTTFQVTTSRLTHFALDVGGVLEFYPTRRIFTRFDLGDTIIRYGRTTVHTISVAPDNSFIVTPLAVPANTVHNFQFSAGVGFRF